MAIKKSEALRNAELDAMETVLGASALLRMYSGSPPSATSDAATGDLLVEITLPSDWAAAASGGEKAMSGTWEDTSANANGTLGYFRFYNSAGTTCHYQGSITATGDGGDMTVDNTIVAEGQKVTVTAFDRTAAGA